MNISCFGDIIFMDKTLAEIKIQELQLAKQPTFPRNEKELKIYAK